MTPRLDAIGIVAADPARSFDFYRRLGVDLPADAAAQPHVEAKAGGVRLLWDTEDTIRSFDPSWSGTGGGRLGLAFACADAAEVDRVYTELTGAGFDGHLEPWDAFWGQRYASLRDPDGNGVDLFAPL